VKRAAQLRRLADETFDLLVVGGGVHGAAAARAGAVRGLATALVEQGDFGHATSANSLKIIHGGLRYLQYGNLRMVREGIRARRSLFRLFPRLVTPLPCVVPTYGRGIHGRLAMGAALAINDALSFDRNRGVAPAGRLPAGRILSRADMLRIAPGLVVPGLSGGALYHDGIAADTERLVLDLVLAAAERGAAAANYLRMEGFLFRGSRVEGVRARDLLSGAALEIRAKVVANAAGPWFDEVNGSLPHPAPAVPLTKALNILVARPLFGSHAVGIPGSGRHRDADGVVRSRKRFFFFAPWRGGTMIGTLYLPYPGKPAACAVTREEIALMVAEINGIHPAARISEEEVCFTHVGLLPLRPGGGTEDSRLLKRPLVVDGARALGVEGLIGLRSVKYTSACRVADEAMELVATKLGRTLAESPDAAGAEASPEKPASDADRILPGQQTSAADVLRGVRTEMAQTLADLVFRRTPLGTFGHPGREALAACAALAAGELGWDAARREREIALVEEEYRRLLGRNAP
jgi:glycerol-3-phosphate dehydrogenase